MRRSWNKERRGEEKERREEERRRGEEKREMPSVSSNSTDGPHAHPPGQMDEFWRDVA
jgi:hypothetical protein